MSIHLTPDTLAAYVTDDLTPEERRQAEAHLQECHTCAQDVREIRSEVAGESGEQFSDKISARFRERLPRFWGRHTLRSGQEQLRAAKKLPSEPAPEHEMDRAVARVAVGQALLALEHPALVSQVPVAQLDDFRALLWSRLEVLEQAGSQFGIFDMRVAARSSGRMLPKVVSGPGNTPPVIEIGSVQIAFRVLDEKPDFVRLEVRAERQRGKPAKNIQVRLISRPSHDRVHEALTDSTGVAQFEIGHGEYRVEVEHEILGAGSMLLDV